MSEKTSNIDNSTLYDIMNNRRFGAEYQPIVELASGHIMGWECLARFYNHLGKSVRPDWVFDALHEDKLSLFNIEYQMKQLQLEAAPKDTKIFLNIDPHAFVVFGDNSENPLLNLIAGKRNLVVEIIENSSASDALYSSQMGAAFQENGVQIALDDIGAPNSMLSFEVLLSVDFLKLDRSWLKNQNVPHHKELLHSLCDFARATGKKLILEGVETENDLEFAHLLGVDYIQGFIYRELFQSARF